MIGAVDIGGTKIAVGMVAESGQLISRLENPTAPIQGPEFGQKLIIDMLHQTSSEAGGQLCGIGIGCTGPVDPLKGVMGRIEFLPGWEGLNLPDILTHAFHVSTAIENDADATALAEATWGVGRGAKRLIYITISTGIGGGIVLDGELYRGADGSHPEIGHQVIDPAGPLCYCGAHGCWESLASGSALAQRGKLATAYDVCEAAERGDASALSAVEQEGFYLGIGLANLISLFVPDIIALGGGVMQSSILFWDKINKVIQSTCGLVPYKKTRLLLTSLGRDVGLLGAAQVWIKRFGS